jgi:putative transcriptional regulator
MTKKAFEQIAEGLNEALAVARGEAKPYRLHVPAEVDVKAIRARTGLSQKDFAATFGFGLDQLKQWEQGRSRPVQALRAYLLLINAHPAGMVRALRELKADIESSHDGARSGMAM